MDTIIQKVLDFNSYLKVNFLKISNKWRESEWMKDGGQDTPGG